MRKLRFFGAVAVVAVLVGTFAALSLLPDSVSAGKPVKTKPCVVTLGDVHYHGRNVHGTDGPDIIDCSGYDKGGKGLHIYGHGGDDKLIGSPGDDHLIGGDGDDELYGGDGDDGLHGGYGDDMLSGGLGDDLCEGGPEVNGDSFIDDSGNPVDGVDIDDEAALADCQTFNTVP